MIMMTDPSRKKILDLLTPLFQDVFDDDDVVATEDLSAKDIEEWDSLNQIKIILACEKAFGIKLNARDINTLENVGAMLDHLDKLDV